MKQFFTIIFSILISHIHSQSLYNIDTFYPVHDLMTELLILEDSEGKLTYNEILNYPDEKFHPRTYFEKYLNLGATYWGKINIKCNNSLNGWTLNMEDKMIGPPAWAKSNGKVDVYGFIDDELIFHEKTGVEYHKKERSINSHWVLNKVILDSLPVDQEITLLIKTQGNSIGYPPYFNLSARHPDNAYYHQIYQFNNSFNIFMFGVTFIILLYHLLQFLYLREKVMFWFSIWLLFITVSHAMAIGLIIGSITHLRYSIYIFTTHGVFYSFWFFGRSFIGSKVKFPKLDKVIIALAVFVLVESLFLAFYVPLFNIQTSFTGVGKHYYLMFIYCILSAILSILLICKNDKFAKYFGIGSFVATIFLLIGTLWSIGYINVVSKFVDPYATGMFIQIIIYSFGIAYKRQVTHKRITEDRIQTQATLSEIQRIKDLDEIKTRFFTNISHEFRTPITLISGPIKNALSNPTTSGDLVTLKRKDLNIIEKNSDRLQHLVDQLLDLSKIESGQTNLRLEEGDMIEFIKSIVFSFQDLAAMDNISYNTSFPAEPKKAYYDKDKLEKILNNLLSNAFKYTPKNGSVNVIIDHNQDFINLEFSNTGKGIKQEEIKRIFERFYRAEGTEAKGSGLGLALTKELVELHDGTISINSTQNKGTNFKIKLPISLQFLPKKYTSFNHQNESISIPQENNKTIEDKIIAKKNNQSGDKPLALIVEDNQDLQYFITEIIRREYDVITAEDGSLGCILALEYIPDIIITDIMMPIKNGYELCQSLKNNLKTSHIPIIMLTAKAGEYNKIHGLAKGADAYLTKPFNQKELIIRMNNLIDSKKKMWDHFKSLDMFLVEDINIKSIDDKFIQDVFKSIKNNLANDRFGVEDMVKTVGLSRSQLHRKLKALIGKSANQLITEIRLNEAHRLLKLKAGSVSEIAYSVGYSNLSYFTKSFKEKFGILPSKV